MEKRLADAYQAKFDSAQKSLPADVKAKLAEPSKGDLPATMRYTGKDWGLFGPNCKTVTFETAKTVFENTMKDENVSPKLKKEAEKLNQLVGKAEATKPSDVKKNLDKMAQAKEVEDTSNASPDKKPAPAEKKETDKKPQN